MMNYDVVIVGGGLVGASLAAALRHSGLSIALLESQPVAAEAAPSLPDDWDSRIYAISPGNAAFLHQCGAWQRMDASRVQQVEQMRVFGDGSGAELDFSAYQAGAPELSFILEGRLLQQALWQALAGQENFTLMSPARCASLVWREESAQLQLEDGRELQAKLVVGADGRDSWVRQQAGIIEPPTLYQQHGVVANFRIEKPHRGTAFQWFQPDGILALLPLPGNMVSMVWSVSPEQSDILLRLPPAELCERVAASSGNILGSMQLVTSPAAFPLRLLRLPHIAKPRLALVGDAAHNVHPLAGQGVNLGFRDARKLAEVLNDRVPQQDCGDIHLLRRYERARREDIVSMQFTTDSLKKLFVNANPLLRTVRNFGLNSTNHIAPLKKLLVRHALL